MKKILYHCLVLICICSLSACSDYLDINENPNNPSNTVPSASLRLRGIQHNFMNCYYSSGLLGGWVTGNMSKTWGWTYTDYIARWMPYDYSSIWPYQSWFIYTAANIPDLIAKGEATEAWHYVGAAQLIHAWGFMVMTDLYGEMPYTEALSEIITPKFDDGKTIYYGCLDMLEKAIENLQKEQPQTAEPFSAGDLWNSGDTDKWIKLAYGLKGRWLLKISKKESFNPQSVLDALDKSTQSNADNTIMRFINSDVYQDRYLRSIIHQNIGYTSTRLTKWYIDLMTNEFTGGSGVMDPRATLLVPSAQYRKNDGTLEYRLSKGIDMFGSNIRSKGGPVGFDIFSSKSSTAIAFLGYEMDEDIDMWASATKEPERKGDSIYVPTYSEVFSWITESPGDKKDDRYIANRYNGKTPQVISTGTFYTRSDSPGHLLCYPEVCFMKAECYFRQGDKGKALTEYKNGIRAHMELLNEKLSEYDQNIYGKQVIPAAEMDKFLASAAVAQTTGELTMAHIMQQKYLACSYSLVNFNDMRRFNYSAGNIKDFGVVYPDYARPAEFDAECERRFKNNTDPKNDRYWFRRFKQSSIEHEKNSENYKASNPEAMELTINSYPVWWDTADE